MDERSIFDSRKGVAALVAVLVKALGGKVVVTQDDFNDVAGALLEENFNPGARNLTIRVVPREERS